MDQDTSLEHLRDKSIFTTGEAAELCRVSQQTIIRCFDNGRLQGFRVPGSRFRRIPRAELIRFMRENEIPLDRIGGASRRVLAVGGGDAMLASVRSLLGSDGSWQLLVAESAFAAGLEIERLVPDVLLIDAATPDLDLSTAISEIRRRERLDPIRVLVCGGDGDEDRLRDARRAGADAILRRPDDLARLREFLPSGNLG